MVDDLRPISFSTQPPPPTAAQAPPLDPFDQPLRHLRRVAPPWAAQAQTACGRALSDVALWLEFEEAKALVAKVGQKRAQFLFCQTCLSHRPKAAASPYWEREPARITADWASRAAWRDSAGADRVALELHALSDLVEAHRDEYDLLVTSRLSDDLSARRKARKRGA